MLSAMLGGMLGLTTAPKTTTNGEKNSKNKKKLYSSKTSGKEQQQQQQQLKRQVGADVDDEDDDKGKQTTSGSSPPPQKRRKLLEGKQEKKGEKGEKGEKEKQEEENLRIRKTKKVFKNAHIPLRECTMDKNPYFRKALEEGRFRDAWAIRQFAYVRFSVWQMHCLPYILKDGLDKKILSETTSVMETLAALSSVFTSKLAPPTFCTPTPAERCALLEAQRAERRLLLDKMDPNRISHKPTASFVERGYFSERYGKMLTAFRVSLEQQKQQLRQQQPCQQHNSYDNNGSSGDLIFHNTSLSSPSAAAVVTIPCLPLVVIVGSPGNGRRCYAQRCLELAGFSYRVFSGFNQSTKEIQFVAQLFLGTFPQQQQQQQRNKNNFKNNNTAGMVSTFTGSSSSSSSSSSTNNPCSTFIINDEGSKPCGYIFENVDLWPTHILSDFFRRFFKSLVSSNSSSSSSSSSSSPSCIGHVPLIMTVSNGFRYSRFPDWTRVFPTAIWRTVLHSVNRDEMQRLLVEFTLRYDITWPELLLKQNVQSFINSMLPFISDESVARMEHQYYHNLVDKKSNWKSVWIEWVKTLPAETPLRDELLQLLMHNNITSSPSNEHPISNRMGASHTCDAEDFIQQQQQQQQQRTHQQPIVNLCTPSQFFKDIWEESNHKVGYAFRLMAWLCSTHLAIPFVPKKNNQCVVTTSSSTTNRNSTGETNSKNTTLMIGNDGDDRRARDIPSAYAWAQNILIVSRDMNQFIPLANVCSASESSQAVQFMYQSGIVWIFGGLRTYLSPPTFHNNTAATSSSSCQHGKEKGILIVWDLYLRLLDTIATFQTTHQGGLCATSDMQLLQQLRRMAIDRFESYTKTIVRPCLEEVPDATWPVRNTSFDEYTKVFSHDPNSIIGRYQARCSTVLCSASRSASRCFSNISETAPPSSAYDHSRSSASRPRDAPIRSEVGCSSSSSSSTSLYRKTTAKSSTNKQQQQQQQQHVMYDPVTSVDELKALLLFGKTDRYRWQTFVNMNGFC